MDPIWALLQIKDDLRISLKSVNLNELRLNLNCHLRNNGNLPLMRGTRSLDPVSMNGTHARPGTPI